MAKTTVLFGVILIILGVIGYTGSQAKPVAPDPGAEETVESSSPGKKSVTALIPAFFGGGLVLCGLLAMKESLLKHAMHGAAMIGLLGALAGAGRGAMGLGKFFSGDPSLNQRSFAFVWLMAVTCAVFVGLCVRSFIAARKRREAEQAA